MVNSMGENEMNVRSLLFLIAILFVAQPAVAESPSCSDEEILGLELTGQLQAPGGIVDQIGQDLALIRSFYPDMNDITVLPSWEPGVISVTLTNEAWTNYEAGAFAELDSLNVYYGAVAVESIGFIKILFIHFNDCYHPEVLGTSYAGLDGVVRVGENTIYGDGDDITCTQLGSYIFKRGWGDCPSGCTSELYWSFVVENGAVSLVSVSSTPAEDSPSAYRVRLSQNTPNPFNPSTTIRFSLSAPGNLNLRVVDISGRVVRHLRSGYFDLGQHRVEWNGMDDSGSRVASGVYFSMLEYGGNLYTGKMVVLK